MSDTRDTAQARWKQLNRAISGCEALIKQLNPVANRVGSSSVGASAQRKVVLAIHELDRAIRRASPIIDVDDLIYALSVLRRYSRNLDQLLDAQKSNHGLGAVQDADALIDQLLHEFRAWKGDVLFELGSNIETAHTVVLAIAEFLDGRDRRFVADKPSYFELVSRVASFIDASTELLRTYPQCDVLSGLNSLFATLTAIQSNAYFRSVAEEDFECISPPSIFARRLPPAYASITLVQAVDFASEALDDAASIYEYGRVPERQDDPPANWNGSSRADATAVAQVLKTVTARQKLGPARFEFRDAILCLEHQVSLPRQGAAGNASVARSVLIEEGDLLLQQSQSTNCDSRLILSFGRMVEKLKADADAIELGLLNIACQQLLLKFEPELSLAISAAMRAFSLGIDLYIGQFRDWELFLGNAASAATTHNEQVALASVADELADEFDVRASAVDIEVPEKIREISGYARGAIDQKGLGFSLIRTLENLTASIFRENAEAIIHSRDRHDHALLDLLAVTVDKVGTVSDVFGKFAEGAWIKAAIRHAREMIETLSEK